MPWGAAPLAPGGAGRPGRRLWRTGGVHSLQCGDQMPRFRRDPPRRVRGIPALSRADVPILQGQVSVEVTTQAADGWLTAAEVEFRLTLDQEGNWTILAGTATSCAADRTPAESASAGAGIRTFHYNVTYTSTGPKGPSEPRQHLAGQLRGARRWHEGQPDASARYPAGGGTRRPSSRRCYYSANRTDSATPGQTCAPQTATLKASLD
ncbi:MAG: hypothetical protein M0C28_41140 [Candidatus Moduliflexus flocculans]|nr:hypothetical protein [Candidatus Moduliflexus flocculans]